jgi:hypothetical protein
MGSFKKLKSSDVITVPVVANKSWNFNYCPVPTDDPYVSYYNGINSIDLFDPNGDWTTNGQYDRLTYRQINQLFYHDFSGSLNTSSLASSLYYESASSSHPTASYFNYNNDPAFISNFPTGANESIKVIQMSPKVYGSRLLPYTFQMSSSVYNFYDDGKGNIYDSFNSNPPAHVGNIFYEQGTVVITSQDFQTLFVLPPVAYNDTYTIVRSDYPNPATFSFNPLLNDDLRGNTLVTQSITLFGGDISFFSTGSSNTVSMSFSGLGVGTYQTFYTFLVTGSYCAPLRSGTGSIIVNVTDPECEFEIGIIEISPPLPSVTSTPTVTPTPTQTVTPTPTISISRTPSITPSITPSSNICNCIIFTNPTNQILGGGYISCNGNSFPRLAVQPNSSVTVCGSDPSGASGMIIEILGNCINNVCIPFTPTPTPSPSVTPSNTPSITPTSTVSATPSVTPSITPSISLTPTTTPSISFTPTTTVTPSITATPSITPSISVTPEASISATPTMTPSVTVTPSITPTLTPSATPSITPSTSSPLVIRQAVSCCDFRKEAMMIPAALIGTVVTSTTDECFFINGNIELVATVTWSGDLGFEDCNACTTFNPCPAPPSQSPSRTPSITVTPTATATPSITVTPTATATPSISITPSVTITPTMTATPSVTITPTMTATPSVTPSTSAPTSENIVELFYGASKGAACSEFAPSTFFCLVGSPNLCDATGLLDSDGLVCYGNAAATNVSEGFGGNVRLWNGTSFGACATCLI